MELEKTNMMFDKWTDNSKDWLESSDANYNQSMEESNCTIAALQENDRMLEDSRAHNEQVKAQQKLSIEKTLSQNEQLKKNKAMLEMQLRRSEEEEERETERLEQARAEHEQLRNKMEQSLNDLTYGLKNFLALGLEFQKSDGDCMKFIFTQIDEQAPYTQFYFLMYVDANNMYQLVDTSPRLDQAECDRYLEELNSSNNIGQFVFKMRKLFVQLVR